MKDSIKIKANASVANVSCGFDCLGYAIAAPSDIVKIQRTNNTDIKILLKGYGTDEIPKIPEKNTAGRAVMSMLSALDKKDGFSIQLNKGIPPGSGLGSSAASAAAAVTGVNYLLGNPFTQDELVIHAMAGEVASAGVFHADNVAPSVMGGMVLIRSYEPLDVLSISVPADLWSTVVLVDYIINTKDAREMLPRSVALKSAVDQAGNLAGFTLGMVNSDFDLISRSMEDLFAEPVRQELIPGYKGVKSAALEAGAVGCGISGSGPAMFAFSKSIDEGKKIGSAMVNAFHRAGLISEAFISQIYPKGPEILD